MDVKASWQQLAHDLGFAFSPGIEPLLESPSLRRMMGSAAGGKRLVNVRDMDQARALLSNPMVKAVLDRLFTGVVTGEYRGYEFVLMRGSKGSGGSSRSASSTVNIGLLFKDSLELSLHVERRRWFSGLYRLFNKKRLVPFPGDPDLDRLVNATSDDPLAAEAYLSGVAFREAAKGLFRMKGEITITDHGVRMHRFGQTTTREEALPYMDAMVDVAEAF